jgi:hypothetical protein
MYSTPLSEEKPTYTKPDSEVRIEKTKAIKDFWKEALVATTFKGMYVVPKVLYKPSGKSYDVISCYATELSKGDMLVEYVNFQYDVIDEDRTLYLLRYNPNFESEYEDRGNGSFTIKAEKLQKVVSYNDLRSASTERTEEEVATFLEQGEQEDANFNKLTVRDLYAIIQNKPVSNKPWLNKVILKNK